MVTISRDQFAARFRHGIDLKSEGLKNALTGTAVSLEQLQALDRNGDGVLAGSVELGRAFKAVDDLDKNGSARSFLNQGEAGKVYAGLQAGRRSGPYYGEAIASTALARAHRDREGYAFENAPTSPLSNLSGNRTPGTTRPSWLKNQNKCNQFVGDALTQAGLKMPTFRMQDGTEHYVNAERLPNYSQHFDRITNLADVKPGDVFVVDYPATGESTAHTEVITGFDSATGDFKTTGAHGDGAYEMSRPAWLNGATYNAEGRYWEQGSYKVYLLRPKLLANPVSSTIRA